MAYVTPTTLAAGATITKTWSDMAYDTLLYLRARPQYPIYFAGAGQTTTSASIVGIGAVHNFTLDVAHRIVVYVGAHFSHSVANGYMYSSFLVDGVVQSNAVFTVITANQVHWLHQVRYIGSLSAGAHTIQLGQATSSGGTVTFANGYGGYFLMQTI